jgi:hypothetical protein
METDVMKLLMCIALGISFCLLVGPTIDAIMQLGAHYQLIGTKAYQMLEAQLLGYIILYVLLGILVLDYKHTEPTKGKTQMDRMIEKGYIYNVDKGRWEKPSEVKE